jgi:hypothetical protein
LLGASVAFAGASVLGSVVAIRDHIPGEPLGIRVPLSVRAGIAVGWGAGVAAPWPMPACAVATALAAGRRPPSPRPGVVCAVIGLGCIAGTLVEPVIRSPRAWSPATRLAIAANLAASVALITAGARHAATARAQARA